MLTSLWLSEPILPWALSTHPVTLTLMFLYTCKGVPVSEALALAGPSYRIFFPQKSTWFSPSLSLLNRFFFWRASWPVYILSLTTFFFFFFFLVFSGLCLWHMEVPKLGVELELQLLAYATATATPDPRLVCDVHHSSWQHQILNPLSEARNWTCVLMDASQIRFCWAMMGTPTSDLL